MNDFFGDAGDCDGDDHQRAMERRTMERLKATARRRGFMDEEQRREAETIAKSFSDGFASGMEEAIAQVQQFIQSNAKQQ